MYAEVLRKIGLTPNESIVYETMLNIDEVNVGAIAVKSKMHRRSVYDSLNKLEERGLVMQSFVKGEKHYKAVNPNRLKLILEEKEDALKNVLPDMQKKFLSIPQKEQAFIYRGLKGYRNYMQDIIDSGEDFYCIGAKGGWFDPRLRSFRLRFYKQMEEKKLNAYHLFDNEMREHRKDDLESPIHKHIGQARFLPKNASSNSAIDFFGDTIVMYTGMGINHIDENVVLFVLKSRELCENMKKWFWTMWEASEEP